MGGEGCWIFCFVFQYNKGLELLKAICRHRGDSKGKLIQSQLDPQRHGLGEGTFCSAERKKIITTERMRASLRSAFMTYYQERFRQKVHTLNHQSKKICLDAECLFCLI